MKRFLIPTLVVSVGCVAASVISHQTRANAATKEHKVAICHGTASAKNPYVLIIVDESAKETHLNGHGQNNALDYALNGGKILTAQQIIYYRSLKNSACGGGDEDGEPNAS
ncbi:MAG TPA: hypothetical protein VGB45_00810 [Abditibacterium sp.]|jgi:hypothetical protein